MRGQKKINGKGGSIPVISDIAAAASVSVATASLALNHHPRISARTSLRVHEIAARMGYVPNHAARRLARSRFSSGGRRRLDRIGFVTVGKNNMEIDAASLALLHGAEQQAFEFDATVTFVRMRSDADHEKVTRVAQSGGVDGWLLTGYVDDTSLDLVRAPHAPCVVIGSHRCTRPVHSVDINYVAAGQLAAQHLASLGHTRIGYIGACMNYFYQQSTFHGFRSAIRELGMDLNEKLIQTVEFDRTLRVDDLLNNLLTMKPRPTALVVPELHFTDRVIGLLNQLKMAIPNEISLLGCTLDRETEIPENITCVELPATQLGRVSASMLREIAAEPTAATRQVLISPIIKEGTTCAAIQTNSEN